MSAKIWLFGFSMVSLFLLSGCIPAGSQLVEPTATPENKAVPTAVRQEPDLKPIEPTVFESITDLSLQVTPTACEDPFSGQSVRFSTQNWNTNFCLHTVPYDEIFSGGPPPDAIPSIDNPKFDTVGEAEGWLADREPVILFQDGDLARAYPLQILTWHEIVNDELNSKPVVITFCPLCNTALVFERPTYQRKPLTFGTSGNLRNSDLVMYDRQTESWWQQFTGEAIVGDLVGNQLTLLPSAVISWADFKTQFPDGQVLSLDTGYSRRYGSNPYTGYDDINASPFLYAGPLDNRLRPMARVLGVLLPDGGGVAYPLERLKTEGIINDAINGIQITAFWKAGTASALDTSSIPSGQDVGAAAVFLREINGQTLTFISSGEGDFQDQQTGSTWNLFGLAVAGPMRGSQLTPLPHHNTFWFAWAAFVPPDTLDGK